MRRALFGLLTASLIVVDGGLAWLGLRSAPTIAAALGLVAAHGATAAAYVATIATLVPEKHRRPVAGFVAYTFSIAFFVPVLGALTLLLSYRALWHPRRASVDPVTTFRPASLVVSVPWRPPLGTFSPGAISPILRSSKDASFRFRALLALHRAPPRDAVPHLKLALGDTSDEVRLLAFAHLERIRREIERRIDARLALEREAEAAHKPLLSLRLAADYWEIAYLGLVEGEVYWRTLAVAGDHVDRAVAGDDSLAAAWFLLGRVRLRQERVDEADRAFERARALGFPPWRVAPYAAETAFARGTLTSVASELGAARDTAHDSPLLAQLLEQWK